MNSVRVLDAGLIGTSLAAASFTIQRDRIKAFARAIGDLSPCYVDDEASRSTEWGDVIAPPTFAVALRDEEAYTTRFWASLGVSLSQVLNAEVEVECLQPILPSRTYVSRVRVADVYEKAGRRGRLVFVVRETVITDVQERVVATVKHTNVVRGVAS